MSPNLSELRTLRGAPLSVLLALRATSTPQPICWLCTFTGYTGKTIQAACALLESLGYINQVGRYAWEAAATLIMDPPQILAGPEKSTRKISVSRRKFSVSRPSSSSSYLTRGESDSTNHLVNQNDTENFRVNLAALTSAGIHEPARSRLAVLPHVTPIMINDHVSKANNIGHAIYRIEHNWTIQSSDLDRSRYYTGQYAEFINHE